MLIFIFIEETDSLYYPCYDSDLYTHKKNTHRAKYTAANQYH